MIYIHIVYAPQPNVSRLIFLHGQDYPKIYVDYSRERGVYVDQYCIHRSFSGLLTIFVERKAWFTNLRALYYGSYLGRHESYFLFASFFHISEA